MIFSQKTIVKLLNKIAVLEQRIEVLEAKDYQRTREENCICKEKVDGKFTIVERLKK